MQKVSFKAADYSQLYKDMEKIKVVREEKIIPKEKITEKISDKIAENVQKKAEKVKDVFVKKDVSKARPRRPLDAPISYLSAFIAASLTIAAVLGIKTLKFDYDHREESKMLKEKKEALDSKINDLMIKSYNNEISYEEAQKQIKKAEQEYKQEENKIINKVNNDFKSEW